MPQITRLGLPGFPLVDEPTLREWLRIDNNQDTRTLSLLLAGATDYLEGLTGRVLASTDYQVAYAVDSTCLEVTLRPLNAVAGVVARLAGGGVQALAASDWQLVQCGDFNRITITNPPADATAYVVTLNAGYDEQALVPASLQQAAAVLVGAGYDGRQAIDPKTQQTVAWLCQRYVWVGL